VHESEKLIGMPDIIIADPRNSDAATCSSDSVFSRVFTYLHKIQSRHALKRKIPEILVAVGIRQLQVKSFSCTTRKCRLYN